MHTYGGDARRAKRDYIMASGTEDYYILLHDIPFVRSILYIHFGDIGVRTTSLLAMCNHTTGRARLLGQNTTRISLSATLYGENFEQNRYKDLRRCEFK
jgi:hypothetical protein